MTSRCRLGLFRILPLLALAIAALLLPSTALGQGVMRDVDDEEFEPTFALVPFAFYSEVFEFAAGGSMVSNGLLQPQFSLVATGFVGTNGSTSLSVIADSYDVPKVERLFMDASLWTNDLEELRAYVDGNPNYPNERAGSNDSSEDNFLFGEGTDHFVSFTLRYVLPLGHSREEPIHTYYLRDGLLDSNPSGGDFWNPLESGRTFVEVQPFYRAQGFDITDVDRDGESNDLKTNGVRFWLTHDNRDFPSNPERGSLQRLGISRDWGFNDSTAPWTSLEAEYSKYFPLGTNDTFRQCVLALNAWTAYVPTWDSGNRTPHRPPQFAGATLGGLFRLRGFPASRFHDKAAVHYAAELRLMPHANPVGKGSFLEFLDIDWIQFVPFAEVGRVSETWSVGELHDDMQWDVGFGVRAFASRIVVRVDFAVSDEDVGVQMMIGQPF